MGVTNPINNYIFSSIRNFTVTVLPEKEMPQSTEQDQIEQHTHHDNALEPWTPNHSLLIEGSFENHMVITIRGC